MATLSSKIFKHHERSDGTYNVKICISHKSERVYVDTEHYVSEKKLSKSLEIKDAFISKLLNKTLDDYREEISKLGKNLQLYTVKDLRDHLLKTNDVVDFFKFCQLHIDSLKANGQTKSATNYNTVRNSLLDFFKRSALPVEEITVRTLYSYERYLRGDREMERKNQFGKTYKIAAKGLSDSSVHNYLRDFSGLFSAAMSYFNKPSLGIDDFADIIGKNDFSVIVIVIDKANSRLDSKDYHTTSITKLYQAFDDFLKTKGEHGIVLFDRTNEKTTTTHVRKLLGTGSSGVTIPGIRIAKVIEDPFFQVSSESLFIQSADVVAYTLKEKEFPKAARQKFQAHRIFERKLLKLCYSSPVAETDGIIRL